MLDEASAKSAIPAKGRQPTTHVTQPKGTIMVQAKSKTHH
jgi:hypothetical protein